MAAVYALDEASIPRKRAGPMPEEPEVRVRKKTQLSGRKTHPNEATQVMLRTSPWWFCGGGGDKAKVASVAKGPVSRLASTFVPSHRNLGKLLEKGIVRPYNMFFLSRLVAIADEYDDKVYNSVPVASTPCGSDWEDTCLLGKRYIGVCNAKTGRIISICGDDYSDP
jgi:hypothetical protein